MCGSGPSVAADVIIEFESERALFPVESYVLLRFRGQAHRQRNEIVRHCVSGEPDLLHSPDLFVHCLTLAQLLARAPEVMRLIEDYKGQRELLRKVHL